MSVNKLEETEPETQRTGAEKEWNRGGLGGPTAVGSNGEANRDGKFFETLEGARRSLPSTNSRRISGGREFGSPRATLQEIEIRVRDQRVCKRLVYKPPR